MKKRRLASLLVLAPMAFLCACTSTPTLSFQANWYKNTAITNPSDTEESLEYAVTFKPANSDSNFQVNYYDGVYKTHLTNGTFALAEAQVEGYIYTTELNISGYYTLNGETSEEFHDYVRSSVKFLPVGASSRLRPVSSEKKVYSTSPVTSTPSSLQEGAAYRTYHYTYNVNYNADLTKAVVSYTDIKNAAETTEREIDIETDITYLDNEQIIFALRGLNLASTATFDSLNPVANAKQTVSVQSAYTTVAAAFNMNGEDVSDNEVKAYTASIVYDETYPGHTQTLTYAATTNGTNNVYRNVLLSMSVPILQSLGTLEYKLTKANFSQKS